MPAPAATATMRAAVQREYGRRPQVGTLPVPRPGPGEVLVGVEAAAVDRGTWHLAHGDPRLARLALGLRRPSVPVPGRDVAGRVLALGAGVTGVVVGDAVVGVGRGTCAERAVVPLRRLVPAPRDLDLGHAAALPVSGITAWEAVHRAGRVQAGHRVLVVGASGGVGTFAVQVARAAGAAVTGVCSAAKADVVRGLGVERVVAHDAQDVTALGETFDVVLDVGGRLPVRALRGLLAPRGTLVLVGGELAARPGGGPSLTGGFGRAVRAALRSPFVGGRTVMLAASEGREPLTELVRLVDAGLVRPVVDHEVGLDGVADAIEHVGAGRARGKVLVRVGAAG